MSAGCELPRRGVHQGGMSLKKLSAALALSVLAIGAHAGALESLENFVRTVHSGRADFTQVVTNPPREGRPGPTRTSSGSFAFRRPDRFRFDYR